MDPAALVSTAGIAIEAIKTAIEAAKFLSDQTERLVSVEAQEKEIALRAALVSAQDQILTLKSGALENQEEMAELRRKLQAKLSMIWKRPFYIVILSDGSEEGPYCPRCWEAEMKQIHLRDNGDNTYYCLECKNGIIER